MRDKGSTTSLSSSLPSSFSSPKRHNQRTETRGGATRPPPTSAFKVPAALKLPHVDLTGGSKAARVGRARFEVVTPRSLEMIMVGRSPNDTSALTNHNVICGQFIQAATRGGPGVDRDEYDDGDCEYVEWECGGEDAEDDEEASHGDDDCSGDELDDSGCQYVDDDEEEDCDGGVVQFFVDTFSDDENGGEGTKESKFETSRTPLMSLLSVESGYVENLSDSACTPDTCTTEEELDDFDDSDCEHGEFTEVDEDLWKSFEQQIFVVDCAKAKSSCKRPPSPPTTKHSPSSSNPAGETCGEVRSSGVCEKQSSNQCCLDTTPAAPSCCDSGRRRVTFKPDSELVVVHHMITWSFAYRSCRKGPWEQFVIDRDHFRRRAEEFGKIFEPCFIKRKQQMQSLP